MSKKVEKPKKAKKTDSVSVLPSIPTWLLDKSSKSQNFSDFIDPWLMEEAFVASPRGHSEHEDSQVSSQSKRVTSPGCSASQVSKKAKMASESASDVLPSSPAPADIPSAPEESVTSSPPPPSGLSRRARPPSASDSGEDVIIDDTTFSDSGDCAAAEADRSVAEPSPGLPPLHGPPASPGGGGAAAAPGAPVPFGLREAVPVDADTVLLTTEPDFCLPVWGAYQVRSLRGAVTVHGAVLTPARAAPLPVFALRVKSIPTLRPAAEADPGPPETVDRLRAECAALPAAAAAAALAEPAGCALLLRRLPCRLLSLLAVRHGETFAPLAPADSEEPVAARAGCQLPRDAAEARQLQLHLHRSSPEWDERVGQLAGRAAAGEQLRVAFTGGKGVGKSTWLYYVLNSLLNSVPHVYVLDFDPGQSEFTPCACVSLLKVDQPIVGPSFTHISQPMRSLFIGEVSIANDPAGYLEAVRDLAAKYRQVANYDSAPLLINTMGWAKGLGEDLLLEILGLVQPTDVLEIVHPRQQHVNFASPLTDAWVNGASRSWLIRQYMAAGTPPRPAVSYRHSRLTALGPLNWAGRPESLAPWMYRQLNTTAFVASLEQPHRTLCQLTPVCVPWQSMALHVTTDRLLPEHMMHAVNGTVVAVCHTDPARWLLPDDRSLFSLLPQDHPRPVCLGFGVVRGVDRERRELYLLTDLPADRLPLANALLRGPHHLLDVFPAESGLRCWTPALTGDARPLGQPNRRHKVARHPGSGGGGGRGWRGRGRGRGRTAEPA